MPPEEKKSINCFYSVVDETHFKRFGKQYLKRAQNKPNLAIESKKVILLIF